MKKLVIITFPRGESSEIYTFEGISVEDAKQSLVAQATAIVEKFNEWYQIVYFKNKGTNAAVPPQPDTSIRYNGYVFNGMSYCEIAENNFILYTLDELFEQNLLAKEQS